MSTRPSTQAKQLKFFAVPEIHAVALASRCLLGRLYPGVLATLTYVKTFSSQFALKRYQFMRQQTPSAASASFEFSHHIALPPSFQELADIRAADLSSSAAEFRRLFAR